MSQTFDRDLVYAKVYDYNDLEVIQFKEAEIVQGIKRLLIDKCVPDRTYRVVFYNKDMDVISVKKIFIPNEITGTHAGHNDIIVQYNHLDGQKIVLENSGEIRRVETDSSKEMIFHDLQANTNYEVYLEDIDDNKFDNGIVKTKDSSYSVLPTVDFIEITGDGIKWNVKNAMGMTARVYEEFDILGYKYVDHVISSNSEDVIATGLNDGISYRIVVDGNVSISDKIEYKLNYFEYTNDVYHIIVENAQEFLNAQIADGVIAHEILTVNGKFKSDTREALKLYQSSLNLFPDGFLSKGIYDSLFDYWIEMKFKNREIRDKSRLFKTDPSPLQLEKLDDYIDEWVYRFRNWVSPFAGPVKQSTSADQILTGKYESAFQAQRYSRDGLVRGDRIHGAIDYRVVDNERRPIYAVENGDIPEAYADKDSSGNILTGPEGPFTQTAYWQNTGNVDIISRETIISYAEIEINESNFYLDNNSNEDLIISNKHNAVRDLTIPIGYTKLSNKSTEMLHLMMFSDLTNEDKLNSTHLDYDTFTNVYPTTNWQGNYKSYQRRIDLLDPTFMKYLPYRRLDGTF